MTGEDDDRVAVEPVLTQLRDDLANAGIDVLDIIFSFGCTVSYWISEPQEEWSAAPMPIDMGKNFARVVIARADMLLFILVRQQPDTGAIAPDVIGIPIGQRLGLLDPERLVESVSLRNSSYDASQRAVANDRGRISRVPHQRRQC